MKIKYIVGSAVCSVLLLAAGCEKDDRFDGISGNPATEEEVPDVLTVQNVRSYMADPNATDETVALFYNLRKLGKTRYLVGQQDAFNAFYQNNAGESDIKKATGSDPGLLGSDFMFITDDKNDGTSNNKWWHDQEVKIMADVKSAYDKGIVNTFCWHLREPFKGETFYAADMSETEKATAFASILPGGANHDYFKTKLDKVADVLNNLKGNDGKLVSVIFRPFHEFDGSWFWWGANYVTPEQYKQGYKFIVEYLRDTKNVHNIIYAFSPDNSYSTQQAYLSHYPGDTYVDVLGMDNYGDFKNGDAAGVTKANDKLKMISDLAIAKVKIAALTETGYQVTASTSPVPGFFNTNIFSALTNNGVNIAYVMFWANTETGYYVAPNGSDFVDFAKKSESVLQNTIPDMYTLPVK